ncbi:MAG TPA: transcriptional repressor LexA [Ignavibacteriaceae bacterium]|nr:transcriptional repressor LexA [Ignavibacteriaceae bacterium]
MKTKLTDRQQQILSFIEQYRDEVGFPPTLREIGKKFEISSTFGVKRHLDALVKKGYLNIESNASRGITILQNNDNYLRRTSTFAQVPIVGRVAAGTPINAVENYEGTIVIDPQFIKKSEDCFALKVRGDSMINAGIFEDDLLIVSPNEETINGDIVVAMLDDEVTVKKLERKNSAIRLIPENDNYKPIEVSNRKNFSIVGKVLGVFRWIN